MLASIDSPQGDQLERMPAAVAIVPPAATTSSEGTGLLLDCRVVTRGRGVEAGVAGMDARLHELAVGQGLVLQSPRPQSGHLFPRLGCALAHHPARRAVDVDEER